jgi:AraC-like DNA-binding protein
MDILFRSDGGGFQGHVVGAMTRALVTDASPGAFVGVRFHPGEASRLLAFPASEATDRLLGLDDLWGPVARDLAGALDDAGSRADQVRALDAALLRRLPRAAPADFRLRAAVRALRGGAPEVAQVAADLGLSPRQLHRLFDARVGVGPKLLARVLRLQRALAGRAGGGATWASVAHDAGYADQAHLVRDCRALAGVAPGALVHSASDSFNPGHVAPGRKTG